MKERYPDIAPIKGHRNLFIYMTAKKLKNINIASHKNNNKLRRFFITSDSLLDAVIKLINRITKLPKYNKKPISPVHTRVSETVE